MTQPTTQAPRTLGRCLRLAIGDGRALLEAGGETYLFNASGWHNAFPKFGKCAVCAAGVVMARTLGANARCDATPAHFGPAWRESLRAIDALRRGAWDHAFVLMHGETWEERQGEFAVRMHNTLARSNARLEGRWREAQHFKGEGAYRAFLDLAEQHIAPALEQCEGEMLRTQALEVTRTPSVNGD